jgi:hypothetical protein
MGREKQWRDELGHKDTGGSINASDILNGNGRASIYTSGFTVYTEDVRCGLHLMP